MRTPVGATLVAEEEHPHAVNEGFLHQALLYESAEDFVVSAAPFIREGLVAGDPVMVLARKELLEALGAELAEDIDRVDLVDTNEWHERPYERLQDFRERAETVPEGRTLRALGEPLWQGSDAACRQWACFESVLNIAFAGRPLQAVCLYDSRALPDRVLDYAAQTHPLWFNRGVPTRNSRYVEPADFVAGPGASPPSCAEELPLEGGSLRARTRELAAEMGLERTRHDDLVLAVQEVVTNAELHGVAPVRARMWAAGPELVCRVEDVGSGIRDPLTGWLPPAQVGGGGWGLPIARQMCDAIEISEARPGTVVSLHVARRS